MRKITKSALAESDLLDIWDYSFGEWGEDQADKYLDELNESIKLLAKNPEMGGKRHYVRDGYRVLFAGSHAVYYTITPSAIHVIRILHVRMDPERHL